MSMLSELFEKGYFTFLVGFLHLQYADRTPHFPNLRAKDFVTCSDSVTYEVRSSKYAVEQKVRRVRAAMTSLRDYRRKKNRNEHIVMPAKAREALDKAINLLQSQETQAYQIDNVLNAQLGAGFADTVQAREVILLATEYLKTTPKAFLGAKNNLAIAMSHVGIELTRRWDDDRYVRGAL